MAFDKQNPKGFDLTRKRVIRAFAKLRKDGFVARANFSCCSTCAGYEIATTNAEKPTPKRATRYVFWHQQGEESFRADGTLHLHFGRLGDGDEATSVEAGYAIVRALMEERVMVTWNGSTKRCINVTAFTDQQAENPRWEGAAEL